MGGNSVKEGETRGSNAINPIISIRPLSKTRGITVTDTALYEVEVKFEVEVEAKNSANAQSKTLDFELKYVAAVENVTELPDPTSSIDYSIKEAGDKTSFDVTKAGLTLEFIQKSQYTDSYGSVYSVEPKASIGVKYTLDTLRVDHIDSLYVIKTGDVSKESVGDNPVTHKLGQKFNSFEQEILFDIAYEAYVANDIEMPYLKINPATLKSEITVSPIEGNTRAVVITKELYDVCVQFSVEVETQNADENTSKTLEFSVNYVGEVTTEEVVPDPEPELVDVKYRKEMVFVPAHDGIPAGARFKVYRDRTYSDGAVRTDEFQSSLWRNTVSSSNRTRYYPDDGNANTTELMMYFGADSIFAHQGYYVENPDLASSNTHRSIAVDSLKYVSIREYELNYTSYPTFEEYEADNVYDEDMSVGEFEATEDGEVYEACDWQNGWYMGSFNCNKIDDLMYKDNTTCFIRTTNYFVYHDQILVIDGKRITFTEFFPTVTYDYSFDEELEPDVENGRGRAKIFKKYMELDFQGNKIRSEICDTIYERLPKDPTAQP